jgi:hypothetical protein
MAKAYVAWVLKALWRWVDLVEGTSSISGLTLLVT